MTFHQLWHILTSLHLINSWGKATIFCHTLFCIRNSVFCLLTTCLVQNSLYSSQSPKICCRPSSLPLCMAITASMFCSDWSYLWSTSYVINIIADTIRALWLLLVDRNSFSVNNWLSVIEVIPQANFQIKSQLPIFLAAQIEIFQLVPVVYSKININIKQRFDGFKTPWWMDVCDYCLQVNWLNNNDEMKKVK